MRGSANCIAGPDAYTYMAAGRLWAIPWHSRRMRICYERIVTHLAIAVYEVPNDHERERWLVNIPGFELLRDQVVVRVLDLCREHGAGSPLVLAHVLAL